MQHPRYKIPSTRVRKETMPRPEDVAAMVVPLAAQLSPAWRLLTSPAPDRSR